MNNICVFDFETDGTNPKTCFPVQIAAVMINPKRLKIIDNSEFNGYMCPPDINDENYVEQHKQTLKWHADLNNLSIEKLIENWQQYPDHRLTWDSFVNYVQQYNLNPARPTIFTAPNPGGHNIVGFDMIIIDRLCKKYGPYKNDKQNLFFDRDIRDALHLSSYWLNNVTELKSYSMDTLRTFFGMSDNKSHDALFDCKQSAQLIIKYMKLAKTLYQQCNIKFKGAFAK